MDAVSVEGVTREPPVRVHQRRVAVLVALGTLDKPARFIEHQCPNTEAGEAVTLRRSSSVIRPVKGCELRRH